MYQPGFSTSWAKQEAQENGEMKSETERARPTLRRFVHYPNRKRNAGRRSNTINFHDPRIQTSIIRPPVTQLTGENTDQAVVQVQDGTLLFFPAWLPHSVDANSSDQPRIGVRCNVMFRGYTETMSKPLWTGSA